MQIRVEKVDYVYNPGTPLEFKALSGIDFVLETGKFLGILGGTGSGKTTLIRHLNGLLTPGCGRVLVDGKDTRKWGPHLRKKVGVVFQRPERQLFEETVFKDISFVLRRFSKLPSEVVRERVRAAAAVLGLNMDEFGTRSPLALSEGEKRRVAIAGILVNEPEVLVLDEPAVGLDPPSIADLISVLEDIKVKRQKTVIVVSHDMDPFLPLLDKLLVLDRGKMAAFGSPEDVCLSQAQNPNIREMLPDIAVLVSMLRSAGCEIPHNEFRIPVLAREFAKLAGVIHS